MRKDIVYAVGQRDRWGIEQLFGSPSHSWSPRRRWSVSSSPPHQPGRPTRAPTSAAASVSARAPAIVAITHRPRAAERLRRFESVPAASLLEHPRAAACGGPHCSAGPTMERPPSITIACNPWRRPHPPDRSPSRRTRSPRQTKTSVPPPRALPHRPPSAPENTLPTPLCA